MVVQEKWLLVPIAGIVGFLGDALLQLFVKKQWANWGLSGYFAQHGTVESLFIASGMLSLFYTIYLLTGLPVKWYTIAIYGVLLDVLFRVFRIFPSLDGYYQHFNVVASGFWGAVPMLIPLWILWLLFKK
jgi:hypothetical protein